MTITERLEKINLNWFLFEPALYKALCSHQIVANPKMQCPMRCGKGRIEYQPQLCDSIDDKELEELLKIECIRILLKHPYERQPSECCAEAITLGSDCVVEYNYQLKYVSLKGAEEYRLEEDKHFEYYAKAIQEMMQTDFQLPSADSGGNEGQENQGDSGGQSGQDDGSAQEDQGGSEGQNGQGGSEGQNGQGGSEGQNGQCGGSAQNGHGNSEKQDASALWEENALAAAEVNEIIKVLESSNSWGSISRSLAGRIIASIKARIDYRKVLQSFRQEVLSSKRRLTRMRPNRRSGFENFGSVYRLTSRLLVAIDVSGSTTDEMVSDFFGVVNKFFKYGIEEIDVIQFDCKIKGEPMTLKKARKDGINIVGRGGTEFQPVFDFAGEKKNYYQGLLIFTDGYADEPTLPDYFHTAVLWVVPDESLYEDHKSWMQKYGKVCFIQD